MVRNFRALKLPTEGSVAFTFALNHHTRNYGVCLGLGHALTTPAVLKLVELNEDEHDKADLIMGDYHLEDKTLKASGSEAHLELIKSTLRKNGYLLK